MITIPDTAKGFYDIIPTTIADNIAFRIELHKMLSVDKSAQVVYLEMCRQYLPIVFSTTFFTFNPEIRLNSPFILRPAQIPAVLTLQECIHNGKDVGINKSRKQGASEICCKTFAANCLLFDYNHFIIGSRKKEYVDNFGDQTTLFAKIDNTFECLPSWWLELCGYDNKNNRKDMVLTIPSTNSSIVGETTNENFGAGSRGTALLLDEFGRVDISVAKSIEGSVHDVSSCVIYSSTHWLGKTHPFNQALKKDSTEVISLLWWESPEENKGLYKTPEPGKIQILDIDYYRKLQPEVFNLIKENEIFELESIRNKLCSKINFIADGLRGLPSEYRAPWFDAQEKKRKGNRRDFVCNVCATPLGSTETPFNHQILEDIKNKTVCPPKYEGELLFSYIGDKIDETDVQFFETRGAKRLKWWGELPFGRPDQKHNYVIGVDPSYGLGNANSAAIIYDVNTREQIGCFVDANTPPEEFADIVVALAYWIGGTNIPFLIWESNAGCGQNFGQRIVYQNYPWVYTQRREDNKTRKRVQKWGWFSNEKAKENLLGELGIALSGGLTGDTEYYSMIVHDENLVEELADYVFKEKGKGLVASSKADLGTGALERHGDRVIAAGLCLLGAKEQPVGNYREMRTPPVNSMMHRMQQYEKEQEKLKRGARRDLY